MLLAKQKSNILLSRSEESLIFAMQLLGDKTRFKIFKLLISNDELCVTEIAKRLNITVSAVSQHFRNFELLGLVDKKRLGQKICYRLKNNNDLVSKLIKLVK